MAKSEIRVDVKPVDIDIRFFGIDDITKYLEDKFGFPIKLSFDLNQGMRTDRAFVKIVMYGETKDIIYDPSTDDSKPWGEKIINAAGADIKYNESFTKLVEKYKYDDDLYIDKNDQEKMRQHYDEGLTEEIIDEISVNGHLHLEPSRKYFRVYLRPSNVIRDMSCNPKTGVPDGEFRITELKYSLKENPNGERVVDPSSIKWKTEHNMSATSWLKNTTLDMANLFR